MFIVVFLATIAVGLIREARCTALVNNISPKELLQESGDGSDVRQLEDGPKVGDADPPEQEDCRRRR